MLKLNIIMGKNKTPNKPKLKNTAQPPASALQKGQGHDRERQPEDLPQHRLGGRREKERRYRKKKNIAGTCLPVKFIISPCGKSNTLIAC